MVDLTGVQKRLALLGVLHAPASGDLDDATVAALLAFQSWSGVGPRHGYAPGTHSTLALSRGATYGFRNPTESA